MKNRSVLLIGNFLSATTGVRSVGEDLARQLSESGWKTITASAEPGRLARFMDMVATAWRRRHEYVVASVEVYSGMAFFWAEATCLTLRLAAKPYILTLHGGNLPDFARRWPGRVRRLLATAAAVTIPSRYLFEEMKGYGRHLRLVPNPLNLGAYQFKLRTQPRPQLVWLRAFHEIYNPLLAPKVMALLAPNFPEINLTMVGPDKGDGSLARTRKKAEELGLGTRINFPGRVAKQEVPQWLNQGDIFLNTTNVDNTPVSVLEAMACGLCVATTNVGGIPYLLEDGQDALLVPPDDPEAMAVAVDRILEEPGLAARLSRDGRRKVEQFDWGIILRQWEELLTAVAEGARP